MEKTEIFSVYRSVIFLEEIVIMSYINSMYGHQSPDFIRGFLAAIDAYAIYRGSGERFIGSPEINVHNAMKSAIIDLGGKPKDYLDLDGEI